MSQSESTFLIYSFRYKLSTSCLCHAMPFGCISFGHPLINRHLNLSFDMKLETLAKSD